jgi:hypothetical protein
MLCRRGFGSDRAFEGDPVAHGGELGRCGCAAGAPLFVIGQAPRHRHVASTALYARDEPAAMRVVTHRWPGGR